MASAPFFAGATMRLKAFLPLLVFLLTPVAALADPCTAIPDNGPVPAFLSLGSSFGGPVVDVIDGDSLCVAVGPRRGIDWVEVRLADFYAPEFDSRTGPAAFAALKRIALGRQANCVAGVGTYDRIAARCQINGQPIGDLMRAAGIREGGAGTDDQVFRRTIPAGLSCAEIRARGGARRGEPGYREDWDGDHDGIACEPYRRRR
jgi:endonuclease YncB( thermonuclease family)